MLDGVRKVSDCVGKVFFLMFLFKVPAGTVSYLDILYGWFANS